MDVLKLAQLYLNEALIHFTLFIRRASLISAVLPIRVLMARIYTLYLLDDEETVENDINIRLYINKTMVLLQLSLLSNDSLIYTLQSFIVMIVFSLRC